MTRSKLAVIGGAKLLLASTVLASGLIAPALAQNAPTPTRPILDDNGVDLATGTIAGQSKSIASGGATFTDVWNGEVNEYSFSTYVLDDEITGAVVYVDGKSFRFLTDINNVLQPELANGATLTRDGNQGFVYTAPNGDRYEFRPNAAGNVRALHNTPNTTGLYSWLDKITRANGETLTWHYRTAEVQTNCEPLPPFGFPNPNCSITNYQRPQSITTNTGRMLKTSYATQSGSPDFNKLVKVTAINLSEDYCDPLADQCSNLTQTWPSLDITTTTNNQGLVQKVFASPSSEFIARLGLNGVAEVSNDGTGNPNLTVTRYPDGKIYQVTKAGVTDTYTYSQQGTQLTVTIAKPNNIVETYVITTGVAKLDAKTDALGRTTTFEYDPQGRLYKTIYPEGDQLVLTHDAIGRVTETRRKAKPGSGQADIVTTAGYVTNCSVETLKACMKPLWTEDARQNRTDYSYSATSGELVQVRFPAAAAGHARAETNYGYSSLYAKKKNAIGQLVDADSPVWKLTSVSECSTSATCVNGANETRVDVSYAATGGGLNLLPTSVTTRAGDNSISMTENYSYDSAGNVITVDGPLAGVNDTSHYFWDSDKRLTGVIGPDPDGSGPRRRSATRYVYTGGKLTQTEVGHANGTLAPALAAMTVTETLTTTYDANDYKTRNVLVAGGVSQAVTQYGYDAKGRLECVARRMNPAVFGSLPSGACTLGTTGSAGADRIIKRTYDAAGQVTKVQSAVGTAEQADETTTAYTTNGQVDYVLDAENNRTNYTYDGFDRLVKTEYPVATKGANAANASDYEQLGYDASGNVTSRRLRDGASIGYSYDNLNRLTLKDLPGAEPDASYAYDLAGRRTGVTQGGQALSFTHDALGRNLTQTGPLGTTAFGYDGAGRRTSMVYPGSALTIGYDYDSAGNMTQIRENGATSGVGVLASYAYDDLGRQTSVTFGNGSIQTFAYDAVSRLESLGNDLGGATHDLAQGFAYNPAGQITSVTQSNSAYAWQGHYNVDRGYAANGLNQVTSAGGTAFGFDARGNLTSNGSNSYTYSSENMLTTAPGAATLSYDPLGRLYETAKSSVTTRFAYDGIDMVAEYDGSNVVQRRYVHGPGFDNPIVWYEGGAISDATRRFLMADERGSVVSITDSYNSVVAINSYDEYGIPAAGNTGRFGYTGQTWLPELGMWHYKARVYSPTLGRFLQADPIGYDDGMNWYNYVGSDPVNGVDPFGTVCFWRGQYWRAKAGVSTDAAQAACAAAGGDWYDGVSIGTRGGGSGGGVPRGAPAPTSPGSGPGGGQGGTPPPPPPKEDKTDGWQCAKDVLWGGAKDTVVGMAIGIFSKAATEPDMQYSGDNADGRKISRGKAQYGRVLLRRAVGKAGLVGAGIGFAWGAAEAYSESESCPAIFR